MSDLKRLPVFVFPSSLTFFAEDSSTHKQMITLYNPYDLVVNFKVLCTAPWKYRIIDPEGSIKPHCCVDIVIRHTAVSPASINATDKFRIQMNEHNSKALLGKKDISVTLLPGKPSVTQQESSLAASQEKFRQFNTGAEPSSADISSSSIQSHLSSDHPPKSNGLRHHTVEGPNYIAIAVAVICVIALMLPSSDVPGNSSLWSIFHLSSHQKMVFAYSLGLVTMVILRV